MSVYSSIAWCKAGHAANVGTCAQDDGVSHGICENHESWYMSPLPKSFATDRQ